MHQLTQLDNLNQEQPQLPVDWNYKESVKKVKQVVFKWKNLTIELAQELWVAREMLSKEVDPKLELKFRFLGQNTVKR